MLLPQQLYPFIPKKVSQWTSQDVYTWFKANGIATNQIRIADLNLDGSRFLQSTPNYLSQKCGIESKIIIKKILEWLQHDHEQFDEYVDQQQDSRPTQNNTETDNCDTHRQRHTEIQKDKQNLVLNSIKLQQNDKHSQAVLSIQPVQKWKNKKKISIDKSQSIDKKIDSPNNRQDISEVWPSANSYVPQSAKLVQSLYELCQSYIQFQYKKRCIYEQQQVSIKPQIWKLYNSGTIGRLLQKNVLINQDTVSRNHAQIIKKENQYFIVDIGSRFGTYIQIENNTIISQGDILAFQDSYIQILLIKINKETKTFDLKIRKTVNKKTIIFLHNKDTVTIGRGQKDISFKDPNIKENHAKIIYTNKGQLSLINEDGLTLRKLQQNYLYELKQTKTILRFGLQIVNTQIVRLYKPVLDIQSINCKQP